MKKFNTAVLLAATITISACGGKKQAEPDTAQTETRSIQLTAEQIKTGGIEMGKVSTLNMAARMRANGTIDVPPQNLVSISAPMGGYLKTTKLLPGMHVRRGEQLAVMEDPKYIQLQQDYLIGKTKQVMLKAEYERQLELNRSKAGSDKNLQQAESDYKSQVIALKAMEETLLLININPKTLSETSISRNASLVSPIDGFVSQVNVNIGKYVNPSDILFELVNPSDIHLNLKVYEKDLDKVFIGQKVQAWTNNKPDVHYAAEVILIGRNVGTEKFVEVHCHFESYDKILIPGMYMNAEMEITNAQVTALPEDCVINDGDKHYCIVEKATGVFDLLEVETGISNDGMTGITAKNNQDLTQMRFVVKNAYSIWMQMNKSKDGE